MNDAQREQVERMADRLAHDCDELALATRVLSEECIDAAMADVVHCMRKLIQAWREGQS